MSEIKSERYLDFYKLLDSYTSFQGVQNPFKNKEWENIISRYKIDFIQDIINNLIAEKDMPQEKVLEIFKKHIAVDAIVEETLKHKNNKLVIKEIENILKDEYDAELPFISLHSESIAYFLSKTNNFIPTKIINMAIAGRSKEFVKEKKYFIDTEQGRISIFPKQIYDMIVLDYISAGSVLPDFRKCVESINLKNTATKIADMYKNTEEYEQVLAFLCNNKNLPEETRQAFFRAGPDYSLLSNPSHSFVEDMYNSVIYTYTELPLNPKTNNERTKSGSTYSFSVDEFNRYRTAQNVLMNIIESGWLSDAILFDIINRIKKLDPDSPVLVCIAKTTNDKDVLSELYKIDSEKVKIAVSDNLCANDEITEERIKDLLAQLDSSKQAMRSSDEQKFLEGKIMRFIKNKELSYASYISILAHDNKNLLKSLISSHFTSRNIIEYLADFYKRKPSFYFSLCAYLHYNLAMQYNCDERYITSVSSGIFDLFSENTTRRQVASFVFNAQEKDIAILKDTLNSIINDASKFKFGDNAKLYATGLLRLITEFERETNEIKNDIDEEKLEGLSQEIVDENIKSKIQNLTKDNLFSCNYFESLNELEKLNTQIQYSFKCEKEKIIHDGEIVF